MFPPLLSFYLDIIRIKTVIVYPNLIAALCNDDKLLVSEGERARVTTYTLGVRLQGSTPLRFWVLRVNKGYARSRRGYCRL